MLEREKWATERDDSLKAETQPVETAAIDVPAVLSGDLLDIWFQPVFSAVNGEVYGYEALARVSQNGLKIDTGRLFERARQMGLSSSLDMLCRETAIRRAAAAGLSRDSYLFINVCPEMLMDMQHRAGVTEQLVESYGLSKDRIIFEITEETVVTDYKLFCRALEYYRGQGYKIAIDDFGVGYGGLKMLANIEPDFVKIDRHFVSNIDRTIVRLNLVDSIATACHRMGIKVIAEGIENEADLHVVLDLGIELLQGYHLGMPSAELKASPIELGLPARKSMGPGEEGELSFIGEVARYVEPLSPRANMPTIRMMFIDHPEVMSLPVVSGDCVIGMVHRKKFFEDQLQGRFGFGQALSTYKNAEQLVQGSSFLQVEDNATLENVAQRIPRRRFDSMYDDICVTANGKYLGTVAVSALLAAITERSLMLARGANPLSGLPGNEMIQREVEKRITQNMHFDVCYIDLDNFKPFNDHYGFEKGDAVIRTLAQIIQEALQESSANGFGFAGHIGGDDFIVLSRPPQSLPIAESIVNRLAGRLAEFHGGEDYERGYYNAANRKGEHERCPLLTLSVGIVSTEINKVSSYAQLASLASEVKKAAKKSSGSTIVRDRRFSEEDAMVGVAGRES